MLNTITSDQIKLGLAVIGSVIGVSGFLYGLYKDRRLKALQKLANSPFFEAEHLQADIRHMSRKNQDPPTFEYNETPKALTDELMPLKNYQRDIPECFPDGYPIGLQLNNLGNPLRTISATPKDTVVIQKPISFPDKYELHYYFKRSEVGKPLRFKIRYETNTGYQGRQTWEIIQGTRNITRIKPRVR